jgi:hypothetical protein
MSNSHFVKTRLALLCELRKCSCWICCRNAYCGICAVIHIDAAPIVVNPGVAEPMDEQFPLWWRSYTLGFQVKRSSSSCLERVFHFQSCLYSFSTQLCAWSSEYFNFASIKLCPLGPDNIEFLVFQRLSSLPLEMSSCHCCRLLQVLWQTTKGIIYDKSTLTPVGEIIQILSNQKPCAFATQENLWSAIGAVDRLQCKGFSCYVNMLFNGRSRV